MPVKATLIGGCVIWGAVERRARLMVFYDPPKRAIGPRIIQEVFEMLSSRLVEVSQGVKPKPAVLQGLLAAIALILMGTMMSLASPALAQEVETFDPDEAFGSGPTQSLPPTVPIDSAPDLPDLPNSPRLPNSGAAPIGAPASDLPPAPVIRQPGFRTAPTLDPVTGQTAPANSPNSPGSIEGSTASGSGSDFANEFPGAGLGDAANPANPANTANAAPTGPGWPANDPQVAVAPAQDAAQDESTFGQDDLIGAAEGVFGKGAQGIAKLIEDLLRDQGEPNGYIVGREAGGAFVVGARYGSGTLHHKIEGTRKVYWTGPSIGLDAGANAGNTFVLVYNLFDTEEIFRRYPAGEGQAYLIGGLHASYMRRDDVVLIPIRLGAGLRLGVNAGYMRFSKKQRWLPF